MYGDYEDYLNGKLEEVKVLMDSMIGYINDNTTAVKNGIDEVKKEYGLTTQNFEGFAEGQSKLLNEWQDGKFVGDIAAVRTSLSNFYDTYVKISEKNTKDIIDTIGKVVVVDSENGKVGVQEPKPATGNGTTPGSNDPNNPGGGKQALLSSSLDALSEGGYWKGSDETGWWWQWGNGTYAQNEFVNGYWFDENGWYDSTWDGSKWKSNSKGWWFEYPDGTYPKGQWLKINGDWYYFDENGYMVTGKNSVGTFASDGKWLGYATGSRSIPHNQLAWTQEEGQELIYRTTDGALLTPLGQGDMVFTNDMTQRLWEIASGANPFSETFASPNISSVMAQTVNNDNKLTVVLPNVESYEDFKRQMKADTNVQQWMQEVTIGQMMGNNKLNKNKY